MAKKDTSPLAMGRQQKGSAVNKKKKKDEEKQKAVTTKSQSSSVSKMTQQQRQNQKTYGTTQPRLRQKSTSTTSNSYQQRQYRAETNNYLKQNQAQNSRTRVANTAKEMLAERENATRQRSVDPKEARRQESARNMRTAATRFASEDRRTAAQAQKMNMPTAEEQRRSRENMRAAGKAIGESVRETLSSDNAARMQRQKSGIQTEEDKRYNEQRNQKRIEVAKNTGRAAKKGIQDTLTGYGKTLADVDEMAKSSDKWTEAKSMKLGIDKDDTTGRAKVEEERQKSIKEARRLRLDLGEKQEKRQKEFDEATKNATGLEKAWYGAVESGTGMATDMAVGAVTGTGQVGALASMGIRSYGATRGQAEKEGATENEDRLYSLLQAGKEVGTEMMFQGAGLAKSAFSGGKVGLSLADRAANSFTRNMTGRAADATAAGIRLLGGTAEENAEEFAGWLADPVIKELTYGRNVRQREAKAALKQESDAIRANITSEEDARSAAAYLNSDRFIEEYTQQYKDAGLKDAQAREAAEQMREYLTASLSGDIDRMAELEDSIAATMSGRSLKDWLGEFDKGELMDTFASTSLLTLTTGLPAGISTAARGSAIRDSLGTEGLRALSETAINFEDGVASLKAQAARDRIDEGKELTSTQVYDLAQAQAQQVEKDFKRSEAASGVAETRIKNENYVMPELSFGRDGSVAGDEIIAANYVKESNAATDIIEDLMKQEGAESLTDTEVQNGSRAIAGFKTGAFTVADANALNYTNTTVRTAFSEATGVDLNQYVVKDKQGNIDIPKTNAATKDALFAMAADNYVKTAEAETANWMDNAKGEVVTEVTSRMGAQGSVALQAALDDVDERDRSTYMMNANAADMMYQTARNMGTEWNTVKAEATRMFPKISEQKLEDMYNAGLKDRADASTAALGKQVKIGDAMDLSGEAEAPKGNVFIDTEYAPKGSVVRVFSEIATNLGVDIHLVDDLRTGTGTQANGQYINGAIYININSDFEKNVGYIFMHEVTHHLKLYAPEQFNALENLVRERWFSANPEEMQNEISKRIDLYRRNGQNLSEEEALEEIIADAAHEFINDSNFARQAAETDPSLAKAVLDSIRNALRAIRRILALSNLDDETHMNTLFSQLGILDEAEKLWLDAYTQAVKNRAAVGLVQWDEDARNSVAEKKSNSAEAKYERGEKLSHSKFNSFYSAHKLNYGRATDETMDDVIDKIRTDGFISTTAIANVLPASINDYVDPERPNLTQSKYGARAGDTVMLVPNKYVDLKSDIIKNGFKPREYEIVKVERDYQPYYELYSKAYDESQTRYSIAPEQDADYMAAVESGDMETAQRMVDEAAARSMPRTKLTGRWYHGTENEFTEFNFSQGGKNGHADGYGIYLTNDPEVASSYGNRMIEGYVNVERPASALTTTTLTKPELHRLIRRTVDVEAETLQYDGYDSISKAKFDTWISNYTDTYAAGSIDKAIDEVIDSITNMNGNDYDIILEIMTGMGIRDYEEASAFYDILTEETGIDGFETKWGDESEMADPNTPTIALAFRSEQIKDAAPVTYDDEGNVIPLSERFNLNNPDIRYSFTTDKDDYIKGGQIPKELKQWAKNIGLDSISKQPTRGPVIVSVKDLRSAWMQKNGRNDEAEVINEVLDTIGRSLTNTIGKYNYIDLSNSVNATVNYRTNKDGKPTSVILSCQVQNAEYEVNFDFTTICSKRKAMQKVLERFIKTEGEHKSTLYDELKLDEEGMYKLRLILEKAGFEVSCKGCFVEQNRYSQQKQAKTIADDWNKALDEWAKENGTEVTDNFDLVNLDINSLDYDEINEAFARYSELIKTKPKKDVATKNRTLIEAHPFFRKRMNPSDYASVDGQRALMAIGSTGGTNLYGLLKRGQSDSKQSVPFTAYNGEVSLLPDNMKGKTLYDYLMSIGGARAQSASDFQIENFYDYMQLVADLSARGLPMHMYTKVIECAELFGMTGIKINLSAMCDVDESLDGEYAGLKLVDGKYEYNISDQSIDYPKAVELQKKPGYSKNIGIIMVTLSKQHMLKSLDDNDVRYIIGYHSSAMPGVVAQMTNMGNATDYTKINKTNKLNDKGRALFAKAMEQAKGETDLAKYKDALRIFDDMIQEEVAADKRKVPRRGNEYARYMSAYGSNTADFNTYEDLSKSGDARKTADNYIEWCMNNDLIPIYFPFAFHDNYYKCEIYDFNMYDNVDGNYAPMEPVQNIYPDLDMTKGETDTTKFMGRVTEMMDEQNTINEALDSQYDNVFDEAKNELQFSITGDEYIDFDEANIDRTQLTPRADAMKTEEQMRDEAYMDAVNSGNMEEAQRLVNEAAERAGYGVEAWHQTGGVFTVFNNDNPQAALNDSETPNGLFFKTNDHDIGLEGKRQMHVFLNTGRLLQFKNREEANLWYRKHIANYEALDEAKNADVGVIDDRMEALEELMFGENVTDEQYNALNAEWDELLEELRTVENGYRGRLRELLNDYFLSKSRQYDGIYIGYDGHRYVDGKREDVETYIVFDSSQVKSADPVTYAEDGSVIPLSERFNPENNDIRYSLPTQDADGKVLTNGQMEYFKNSQARDAQGRLVRVYHTTNRGGFTVFDPSYSDDNRSLFFASNFDVSQTYGWNASKPIEFLSNEEQQLIDEFPFIAGNDLAEKQEKQAGYYTCYLNLENPLIVDAKGANWNSIPYGESGITIRNLRWNAEPEWDNTEDGDVLLNGYVINFVFESLNDNGEWETNPVYGNVFENPNPEDTEWFPQEDAAALFESNGIPARYIDDVLMYADENPMDGSLEYEADEDEEISLSDTYKTRDLAQMAQNEGHDGVIIRNCRDIGGVSQLKGGNPISDIYIAFSSNQIKDIRNENPTENPDIRYSITPEDEGMSKLAYEDAMDDSYEALARYEEMLDDPNAEQYFSRPFKEEDVTKFFDSLRVEDAVPSADPSFEEDRVRRAKSKAEFYNSVNAKWNDRWTTEGEVLDLKSVKKDIKNLVMGVMANSDTDAQYRNKLVRQTLLDVRTAYQLMKQDRTDVASYLLFHSAQRMIEGVEFIQDDTAFQEYKEIRDYLRTYRINAPEEFWENESFLEFRKEYYGRLRIGKGNSNIEDVYKDLADRWPHLFNETERENADLKDKPWELLQHIGVVVDSNVTPFMEAYSSEEAMAVITETADALYDIMAGGKEVVSLADSYKQRFDEKTKAMKQRHAEAILRMRKAKEEGIKKERQKFREYKERQKEKKAHSIYFDRIVKTHKTLVDRLVSNTADKNIPEQYKRELANLLAAFDLQTAGSKAREERTGHKAKNTIKLNAIKDTLRKIEDRTQLFHVSDAITDIMDGLKDIEGKTIDELSATELSNIDKMLRSLLHEFNTYRNVKAGAKRRQAADIGAAQVESDLAHAKKYGRGNDYHGFLGALDKLVNMDEMTPAYLFKRIDPNKQGLGLMYGEIRKSLDTYIRNQNQLNGWMEEIVGKYHQKGILWNKYGSGELANWRSTNYKQTFNLTNGTVELTPAQMMSLYCLSRRNQAYRHMVGAGIVVAPVSFQAKIMSDIKERANMSLPVILTDADIQTICASLTPEQVNVANQLQELMSTKMADWGNDASMRVLGIELFNETDYFPIKSDKAALEKDLNDQEFVEAIRNFGFTKAVQPGARNAIMVEDIFDVVAEHCNNMNLYNAYSESINDFMKVYNYRHFMEDGSEYTVQQSVAHAYSRKATTFIMSFMRDLNGNVSGRDSGIESMMQTALGNAKKASVFANGRVALQQPTAITRAFAVIDPKYLKGVKPEKGAMQEMFEHCPIALWKSWGYYDINMGRSIEDIMMNNGSWAEDKMTDLYGQLDNVTWTAIWQMVKAEMKDTHPNVEIGSDEYFELCNERMTEIVDLTQVVDSPLHRSHGMRDKSFFMKLSTSFMAEPTLTFNMIKDGYVRSYEAFKAGDKAQAAKIFGRTSSVALIQAAAVASCAAIWDALRGKNPGDDDDDEELSKFRLWWLNTIENFKDETLKPWNKIYIVKDIASIFEGWDNKNLAFQGYTTLAQGLTQMQKKLTKGSKTSWWTINSNIIGGFGYLIGVPFKTVMKDSMSIYKMLGFKSDFVEKMLSEEKTEAVLEIGDGIKPEGLTGKLADFFKEDEEPETTADSVDYSDEDLPDNLTEEQKEEIRKAGERRTKKGVNSSEAADRDKNTMLYEAEKAAAGYEGSERDKKIWSSVSQGYKSHIESGDFAYIARMRDVVKQAGGDLDYFDEQINKATKSALKKTIEPGGADTESEMVAQQNMRYYLQSHGVTQEEISADICYKSDAAKDLKVAFRLNDEQAIIESSYALMWAGITQTDIDRLYKNRNRMDLTKYDGKYKDRLKSTGNFIWPTEGVITSHFGYRNAPTAGASSNHPAIDIGAPQGTAVVAADGGTVIYAGRNSGYGNSVGIKHDNGMVTYYNHLYSWNVKVGDTVGQGQQIAQVGSTGISTGPHLDFKILDTNGEPVDPEQYLQKRQ